MEGLNADQRAGVSIGGKSSYTIDQAAAQLDRAGVFWSGTLGQATQVTYAYRATAPAQMPDDTAGFAQFSATQIDATERALAAWSAVSGITFVRVGSGTGADAYSNNATILFSDYTSGEAGAAAFTYFPGNRSVQSVSGDVWVNSSLDENRDLGDGGLGYLTLLHEIGHSIGLSHPSDYDAGDDGGRITYAADALYYEDSIEYTVMSYFDARVTGATIEQTRSSPLGPLIDDIAAAQRAYGANTATNRGDTIYTSETSSHQATWQTIWDGGGVDSITAFAAGTAQKIDLHAGAFSDVDGYVGNLSIAQGTTIENAAGGSGADQIFGNDVDNILSGSAGDDSLSGGRGDDTYVGGAGYDIAILTGNAGDYRLTQGGANGFILAGPNGTDWFDPSIEVVQFANGQYLSVGDVPAYVAAAGVSGTILLAPASNPFDGDAAAVRESGTAGFDMLYLDGNAADYTLGRAQSYDDTGSFILTYAHGVGTIYVDEAIDQIQFLDGQYLALRDLPAYIAGDPSLYDGGAQDDLLYQTRDDYQTFTGGPGFDELYLRGNVQDYRLVPFAGQAIGGPAIAGDMLVDRYGNNGLLIDGSVEQVHFQNGQYLALGDVPAYVAAATNIVAGHLLVIDEALMHDTGGTLATGAAGADILLLNGDLSEFAVSATTSGDYRLIGPTQYYDIDPSVEYLHFTDNHYVAVADLAGYLGGSTTATDGTNGNDAIYASIAGNQYIFGNGGTDDVFLHGNTHDYTLRDVSGVTAPSGAMLNGYELVGDNGSGNIYIDNSTELVHFQNGQYLSYADVPAYIHGFG